MHSNLPFLPERMKINKCNRLVCNLYDFVHILIKAHKVIQFNQEEWLKEYIDMNTKLRIEAKNDFGKDFLKLMNSSVFGKTMENVREHRYIKFVTTDKKRNQLVSEPNYHTTKYFSENLLAIEMKNNKSKNE